MRALRRPLDVVGEVEARSGGESVLVTARHDIIAVDVPTVRAGVIAFRAVGGQQQRAKTMQHAAAALHVTDLNVQFQVAGRTVARLGTHARPGLLSRLLGVRPLEIRLSALGALIRAPW